MKTTTKAERYFLILRNVGSFQATVYRCSGKASAVAMKPLYPNAEVMHTTEPRTWSAAEMELVTMLRRRGYAVDVKAGLLVG